MEVRNGSFEVESLRLIWYAEKTGTRLFRFMKAGAVETADPRACEADAKALHHSPLIHTEATGEYTSTFVMNFIICYLYVSMWMAALLLVPHPHAAVSC